MKQNYDYLFDHVVVIQEFEDLAGYLINEVTYNSTECEGGEDGGHYQTLIFKAGDKTIIYKSDLYEGDSFFWNTPIYFRKEGDKWKLKWEPKAPNLDNPVDISGKLMYPYQMEDVQKAIDLGLAKHGLKVIAEVYLKDCEVMLTNAAKVKVVKDLAMAKARVKKLEEQAKAL